MARLKAALIQKWRILSSAPHRMMFFGGVLELLMALAFWSVELMGRYTPLWPPITFSLPTTQVHAFTLLYGPFQFFIFGFLMTTYPRWMNGRELSPHRYVPIFPLLLGGMLLFWAGAFGAPWVSGMGVLVMLVGWGRGLGILYQVYREAPSGGDRRHETLLNIALAGGWLGTLAFGLGIVTDSQRLTDLAVQAGIWLYLLPVFVTVCHRMIPFFGSCVLPGYRVVKPVWSLPLLVICAAGHFLLMALELRAWLFLTDAPLAFLAIHHSLRWNPRRALGVRLLAVLHIAFAWLGLAMTLYTVQSLALLLAGRPILGQAPLHSLTIGFFLAMVVGMVTRVTLGHSGRQLFADRYTWICFMGVNAAALARLAAELPGVYGIAGVSMNLVAVSLGLVFLTAWAGRYAPLYLRPRADGRPG